MTFDSRLAEVRFGTGFGPGRDAPSDMRDMLSRLSGPDKMARAHPIPVYDTFLPLQERAKELRRARREAGAGAQAGQVVEDYKNLLGQARQGQMDSLNAALRRAALTHDGLRERLTRFWADHFTVRGKGGVLPFAVSSYVETAIRPNMTGSFGKLLRAAVTHEMMLVYLDQVQSVGPEAKAAQGGKRGLNENLAREVLELHTLGVGGSYGQDDVRQLAELFTGLSSRDGEGMVFKPNFAEPGVETVLGVQYGGDAPDLADIHTVLDDLARHPDTARHIAGKLATHFVADAPDPGLVNHITAAFMDSDGDLMACYGAMLDHPAAWDPVLHKARQPFDFLGAGLRALDVSADRIQALGWRKTALLFQYPMRLMGQDWERPRGPDGLPEAAENWITPQGMAARIQWAMSAPGLLLDDLPDPRAFVAAVVGPGADDDLLFAAAAAETRGVGLGLVLSAPQFQRR